MFLGQTSMGAMGIRIWRMIKMAMLHPPSTARADAQKFGHLAMVGIGVRGSPGKGIAWRPGVQFAQRHGVRCDSESHFSATSDLKLHPQFEPKH